jgi:large subunit ribosomal protein L23
MKINTVLKNPILTEKATKLASQNIYMFNVNLKSNKHQIKFAIEEIYPVKIKKIRTHNIKGKIVKRGRKGLLKKLPNKKIAYIQVKEGKLDIFPKV